VIVSRSEYIGGTYLVTGQMPGGPQLAFLAQQQPEPGVCVTVGLRADAQIAVVGP